MHFAARSRHVFAETFSLPIADTIIRPSTDLFFRDIRAFLLLYEMPCIRSTGDPSNLSLSFIARGLGSLFFAFHRRLLVMCPYEISRSSNARTLPLALFLSLTFTMVPRAARMKIPVSFPLTDARTRRKNRRTSSSDIWQLSVWRSRDNRARTFIRPGKRALRLRDTTLRSLLPIISPLLSRKLTSMKLSILYSRCTRRWITANDAVRSNCTEIKV